MLLINIWTYYIIMTPPTDDWKAFWPILDDLLFRFIQQVGMFSVFQVENDAMQEVFPSPPFEFTLLWKQQ